MAGCYVPSKAATEAAIFLPEIQSRNHQPATKNNTKSAKQGTAMANGNGSTLTPIKTIMICISITVAVNGWSLLINQEHGTEIANLRHELDEKTDKRYRATDAERDFKLVEFRFERNEEKLRRCELFIESHRTDHNPRTQTLEIGNLRRQVK